MFPGSLLFDISCKGHASVAFQRNWHLLFAAYLSNELHTSTDFLLTGIGPSNDFAKEEIDTAISILSSIKQLL